MPTPKKKPCGGCGKGELRSGRLGRPVRPPQRTNRFALRYRLCMHATKCNRMCGYIDKEPGEEPRCTDLATGKSVLLYDALEREDFQCPQGLF